MLQPTSPLRNQRDIHQMLYYAKKYKLSSIHSVSNYLGKTAIKKKINILNKKNFLKLKIFLLMETFTCSKLIC